VSRPLRLAIIATHPIQYYVPVYRALAQVPDLEIRVFFGSDFSVRGYRDAEFGVDFRWDVPLTEGYDHVFLSNDPRINGAIRFWDLRASGLSDELRRFRPDCALISAYMPFFWWEVMAILRAQGIPTMLRAEATDAALPRSTWRRVLRSTLLRIFYRGVSRFLAIGYNARRHYVAHGIAPERIGWVPYCVDSELLARQVEEFLPQRERIRRELGFSPEDTVFIFTGKLIPKKDPLSLARALVAMPEQERRRIGLIVMGTGELAEPMEVMCREALGSRCVFPGFVNQSQIGRYYAAADSLVLPSAWGETWGLVVNEALQFGVPAVVSDRVGCHPDLIVEGRTGLVFPAGRVERLTERLLEVGARLRADREGIRTACREIVRGYSVGAAADGIRAAVESLFPRRGRAGVSRHPRAGDGGQGKDGSESTATV